MQPWVAREQFGKNRSYGPRVNLRGTVDRPVPRFIKCGETRSDSSRTSLLVIRSVLQCERNGRACPSATRLSLARAFGRHVGGIPLRLVFRREFARMASRSGVLRIGVGGPVGSGKTALVDALCKRLREKVSIAVVTNDIYTREDAEFLIRSGALPAERIRGVETGGCPHTAIREDASINLAAIDGLTSEFGDLDLIIVESGGDNLAATFSPELSDLTLYVIDVAAGDKIPRKGGPGIMRSDLLIINKIDLAPYVGASLEVMERDARKMRGTRPFVFTNLKTGHGLDAVIDFIIQEGMLAVA